MLTDAIAVEVLGAATPPPWERALLATNRNVHSPRGPCRVKWVSNGGGRDLASPHACIPDYASEKPFPCSSSVAMPRSTSSTLWYAGSHSVSKHVEARDGARPPCTAPSEVLYASMVMVSAPS